MKGLLMTAQQTILVAGATGQQGGAVVRHLSNGGFTVRALTRDPDGDRARALRAGGVEVVRGDLTDRASLDPALEGVHGVAMLNTPCTPSSAGSVSYTHLTLPTNREV